MDNRPLAYGVEPSATRFNLRLARYQALAEAIAEYVGQHADVNRKLQLLDIGVGNGRTIRYLEPTGADARLDFHGIDLSPRRLAGLYAPDRWRLVQGNVEQGLPYAAGQFDVAVCEQVLEHLTDPESVLREIGRVLRPGGLLITGVPTFPIGVDVLRRHLVPALDRMMKKPDRGHAQVFTSQSFVRLIGQAGCFDVTATRGFRIVSGIRPLEDTETWYRLNRAAGRAVPSLCIEVQVLARKKG